MKVAQMFATVPDLLPPEFADQLTELQTSAPAMGPAFVRRRMAAELGPDWQTRRFASFDLQPAAAASLGQVHRARSPTTGDASRSSCSIRTCRARWKATSDSCGFCSVGRQLFGGIDTREVAVEISERIREELDYDPRGGGHVALRRSSRNRDDVAVPARP